MQIMVINANFLRFNIAVPLAFLSLNNLNYVNGDEREVATYKVLLKV